MPNPFESEFSQNRHVQNKIQELSDRKEAEQQAAEEHTRVQKQKELQDQTIQEEIEEYDQLIAQVLEDLKDFLYPNMTVASGERWQHPETLRNIDLNSLSIIKHLWILGEVRETIHRSPYQESSTTHILFPKIVVGLSVSEEGAAQEFKCLYLRKDRVTKVRESSLTKESLMQTLAEMHEPNPQLEEIVARDQEVRDALNGFRSSQTLRRIGGSDLQVKVGQVVEQGYDDPVIDSIEQKYDDWSIGFTFTRIDALLGEVSRNYTLLGVTIVFDENGQGSHYECYSNYDVENGHRNRGYPHKDNIRIQSALDKDSLVRAVGEVIELIGRKVK